MYSLMDLQRSQQERPQKLKVKYSFEDSSALLKSWLQVIGGFNIRHIGSNLGEQADENAAKMAWNNKKRWLKQSVCLY